ncbi:MAG: Na+/H+ antiporter NhaA [Bacteroidales bacterium]|nr:Na+/H+ antiporter NhaA [Bacteroidales bacterium]
MSAKQSRPIPTLIGSFQRFFKVEAAGGILLLVCTAIAMIMANSGASDFYNRTVNWELSVQVGNVFKLSKPLILWINDGLMAVFFFVVGLEIKREILVGELSSFRQAVLPIMAAVGGMVIPATMFAVLHGDNPGSEGWGIPMATDIAFSLGILSLLGKRVPLSLKVFLAAFAIVDDMGAVVVIAAFYSESVGWDNLLIAMVLFIMLYLSIRSGMRNPGVFLVVSIFIWYYVLKSGLHPTIAGVALAFIMPAKRSIKLGVFNRVMKSNLKPFENPDNDEKILLNKEQLEALDNLEVYFGKVHSPLQSVEHRMHGFTSYFVMPVFALANAGVLLSAPAGGSVIGPLSYNIALALIVGKVLGIMIFAWIGVKLKITALPPGTKWMHLIGLGFLGGIGFTMSMFISSLAFQDAGLLNHAKVGILAGSLLAGITGYLILKSTLKPVVEKQESK